MQFRAIVLTTSTLLTGILLSTAAAAGTSDGGGGIGVRCFHGSQSTLELLDLHEAQLAGLKSESNPRSEADAVDLVATKFATHNWVSWSLPSDYIQLLKTTIVERDRKSVV